MPKLAANLNYLFTEVELLERFDAAARAGFRGVEYQFPYDFDRRELSQSLRASGLEMVLINLPAGDAKAGDAGIACHPQRVEEFRRGVESGIEYAESLGCRQMNCLAGIAPSGVDAELLLDTLVDNLRFAAARLADNGLRLLIEPINTRDRPGFFVASPARALEIIDTVDCENLFLQFDVYHAQIMQGDIVNSLEAALERIGHVQIADHPGRHEPGTGELNYPFILSALDSMGYGGWVGCEYAPSTVTERSLDWARAYLDRS